MTDRQSSSGGRDPFDICEMIVTEEFYLDETTMENSAAAAIQSYGYAARDRIRAAKREVTGAVAQAAPAPEPSLNETAVALLRRAFTAAKLPPKLEGDISIFLLALSSTEGK